MDDHSASLLARDLLDDYSIHLWQSGDVLLQGQAQGLGDHHGDGGRQDNLGESGQARF